MDKSQEFENGYNACMNEAEAGQLNDAGIYNQEQLADAETKLRKELPEKVSRALNDIKGTYRLPDHGERLFEKIMKEVRDE